MRRAEFLRTMVTVKQLLEYVIAEKISLDTPLMVIKGGTAKNIGFCYREQRGLKRIEISADNRYFPPKDKENGKS